MRLTIFLLSIGLVGIQLDASAQVHRSQTGMGSALIVPYWTAAGGNDSLLSIRNDSDQASVAKLHWLDDQGQLLQSFNVYLDAGSVWTGAVTAFGEGATLLRREVGCVLPSDLFTEIDFNLPALPLASRRGSLEIIEMASVEVGSDLAANQSRWIDCDALATRFEPGGPWIDDINAGLSAPTQRLSASVTIIDVTKGGMNTVAATALAGFSDLAQHSEPDSNAPDLSHAFDSEASSGGVRSLVCPASGCRTDEWADPISAVAAVLMTTSLRTDYTLSPDIAGEFEWMIHRPLKRYEAAHDNFEIGSAPVLNVRRRDGSLRISGEICIPTPPPPMLPPACSSEYPLEPGIVQHSLPFNASAGDIGELIQSAILGHPTEVWPAFALVGMPAQLSFLEGAAELSLGHHDQPLLAPDGTQFRGEPVIGFGIQQFTNGTLIDGQGQNVLANYRGTEVPRRILRLELPD